MQDLVWTVRSRKRTDIMAIIKDYFRPEFLNRFNGIIEFKPLNKASLLQIVDLMLDDVKRTLAKKEITMTITDEAKNWLIDNGYDELLGARPLRRVVEQHVRDNITDYYLEHPEVKNVHLTLNNDKTDIKVA